MNVIAWLSKLSTHVKSSTVCTTKINTTLTRMMVASAIGDNMPIAAMSFLSPPSSVAGSINLWRKRDAYGAAGVQCKPPSWPTVCLPKGSPQQQQRSKIYWPETLCDDEITQSIDKLDKGNIIAKHKQGKKWKWNLWKNIVSRLHIDVARMQPVDIVVLAIILQMLDGADEGRTMQQPVLYCRSSSREWRLVSMACWCALSWKYSRPGVNDNLVKPAVTTLSARKSADWWRGEKLWRVSQHHMDTSVGSWNRIKRLSYGMTLEIPKLGRRLT